MLKKISIYTVLLIGVLIFSISSAQAVPLVSIEGPATTIYTGTPFDINVRVDGVGVFVDGTWTDGLLAFGFNTIAPASWDLLGTTVGPSFTDDSVFFGGNPQVAGDAFPAVYGDNILLAALSYRPTVAGIYTYSIAGNLSMNNTGGLFFEISFLPIDASTDITVNRIVVTEEPPQQPVPEPATITLLGLGLLALSGIGYKYMKMRS